MNPEEEQTVLMTIMPRGVTFDAGPLPVSVIVSPRLRGDNRLAAFPDWLKWTRHLHERGLTLSVRCGNKQQRVEIDRSVLRPDLWEQLFNEKTFVRSYEYPDYSERGLITYSMRDALSAVKSVYQQAAVDLAQLDDPGDIREQQQSNRYRLAELLAGLDVHWNGRLASEWRSSVRKRKSTGRPGYTPRPRVALDEEGLILGARTATDKKNAALPFAVFHHMPTPSQAEVPLQLNTEEVLDFHQALSSLNSYPALLRALGLVFDLELPAEFVTVTDPGKYGTLSVAQTSMRWQVKTTTPELATAYVNLAVGQRRLFLTAPLVFEEPDFPHITIGLIHLDPENFGLAQVDVDGAMHKTMILAETLNTPDPDRNRFPGAMPEEAPNPDIYDRDATLPSLRSGGFSLFADQRGLLLLDNMAQSNAFNDAVESGGQQKRPFFAEDLLRGYRIDVWNSQTADWHSLHRRTGLYRIGNLEYSPGEEEGFIQMAAMQPAPESAEGPDGEDLYLHEAIARWAGWSLSVPMPGKHLSRYGDPDKAIPPDDDSTGEYLEDQPDTPFKMTVHYEIVNGSLPRLVFGRRYRLRARAVDLAGNSLNHDSPLAALLATFMALPRNPDGRPYLRYEPVNAPILVIRDPAAVTGSGSAVDRLVIRTFNANIDSDDIPADTTASDRHLLPPRTSVEMAERLGMFDDGAGNLKGDAATWQLIVERDAGELNQMTIAIAGQDPQDFPVETADQLTDLPYLPDLLAEGAALRSLPGTPGGTLARVGDGGAAAAIDYTPLSDPNPRPSSATLISFNGGGDWQQRSGLRLALAEPQPDQVDLRPHWDPVKRLLTVFLAKGQTVVVPLSTYLSPQALKLMGQWDWLRQYIEFITIINPQRHFLQPGAAVDRINHILQRSVEGGHWLINPPVLLTLVHAVQQTLGKPVFAALNVDHDNSIQVTNPLQTARVRDRQDPVELAPITAWRHPGATDTFLLGAIKVHGASSVQLDLKAEWSEPTDDESEPAWTVVNRTTHVETIPLPLIKEGYLHAPGTINRAVGYYDPENDQIAFVRYGDRGGPVDQGYPIFFSDAAPRHVFNDTRRRKVAYTAVATSRYREYFPSDADQLAAGLEPLGFQRHSEPVIVDVPASARPAAPGVAYVVPTFGWQRQSETNLKRSVRFGGGLRVYVDRPWFSSGEGELLGVALWNYQNGSLDESNRDKFKSYFTQWGMDPIWKSANLSYVPSTYNFPDNVAFDFGVALEERNARLANGDPGRVDVAGFPVTYDPERQKWFADLTLRTNTDTYMPFVRLALVRYQPHALADAQISRVVLADFAQITPDRSVLLTIDPQTPRRLRVVVSGIAPIGPEAVVKAEPQPAQVAERPTQIRVRVQVDEGQIVSDLGWRDVDDPSIVQISPLFDGPYPNQPYLAMWVGTVTFAQVSPAGKYRLLIEEYEYISSRYTVANGRRNEQAGRLIFLETIDLGSLLLAVNDS
jgi:hypothetical protein